MNLKILHLDIETAPNLAYVWGLFKENIPLQRIVNSGYVLCWSASWEGEKKIMFASVQRKNKKAMLRGIHKLLDEADVVVHYNGEEFDIPTLNKEFVTAGMKPPSPYKQVDLIKVVRRKFRFPSNKLDYVLQTLGVGHKVRHPGFEMWVKCMAGDATAWRQMERYNRGDVRELKKLYHRLMPWIDRHPNLSLITGALICPRCGSKRLQSRGTQRIGGKPFKRYQCQHCGGWAHAALKGHTVSM